MKKPLLLLALLCAPMQSFADDQEGFAQTFSDTEMKRLEEQGSIGFSEVLGGAAAGGFGIVMGRASPIEIAEINAQIHEAAIARLRGMNATFADLVEKSDAAGIEVEKLAKEAQTLDLEMARQKNLAMAGKPEMNAAEIEKLSGDIGMAHRKLLQAKAVYESALESSAEARKLLGKIEGFVTDGIKVLARNPRAPGAPTAFEVEIANKIRSSKNMRRIMPLLGGALFVDGALRVLGSLLGRDAGPIPEVGLLQPDLSGVVQAKEFSLKQEPQMVPGTNIPIEAPVSIPGQ